MLNFIFFKLNPLEKGLYPLIIISHGAGGDWDTHFALAHHLATHGFIVFCLEHIGSNTKMLKRVLRSPSNPIMQVLLTKVMRKSEP